MTQEHIHVNIYPVHTSGPLRAKASVSLDGCFAIRGVRILEGSKGLFVSMPSYKVGAEYKDVCFPCTKEFKRTFDEAVLTAYQHTMDQLQEAQEAPEFPEMTMQ